MSCFAGGHQEALRGAQLEPQPPSPSSTLHPPCLPVAAWSSCSPGGGVGDTGVSAVCGPFLSSLLLALLTLLQGTPTFQNLGESCAQPGAATPTSVAPIRTRRWARVGQTWRSWPSPCRTRRVPRQRPCRCCSQVRPPTANTTPPPMVLCSLASVRLPVSSRCTETSSSRGPEGLLTAKSVP